MRRWRISTGVFCRFTSGSGARPFRRGGSCGRRFCSFSTRSGRSGDWSGGSRSTCCFAKFVGLPIDEKVFDAIDLLQEPRPPAHAGDRATVPRCAARPAGGEGAFERGAFFGRRDPAQSLGVDEELLVEEPVLGRRPEKRFGRAGVGGAGVGGLAILAGIFVARPRSQSRPRRTVSALDVSRAWALYCAHPQLQAPRS